MGLMNETGWQAVGRLVKERRRKLGLNQEDLKTRGGPGVATVGKIERAAQDHFPLRTQQQLEHALAWRQGAIQEILDATTEEWWGDPEHPLRVDLEQDLIESSVPERSDSEPAEVQPVRAAVQLGDADLLAELTYRIRKYAELAERASAAPGAPASARDLVLDELVRRGRNPGWLMDATGLDVDELLPFLEQGEEPRGKVARRIEKALGWSSGVLLGNQRHEGADEFVAQLRRVAG